MAFEIKKKSTATAETPEALFRDLRGRKVEGLLVHQGDLLRDYHQHALDAPDVAVQSPTGSGKTLVGLLIAEWRRRRFSERVVYLCPTNQLVQQVASQAKSQYGIDVVPFTGKKADYRDPDKTAYLLGNAVAVTSYGSLFNVKPFFEDPHVIILDDAHANPGEPLQEIRNGRTTLEVFEESAHGHPRGAEEPFTADFSGNAFNRGTLSPIEHGRGLLSVDPYREDGAVLL